MYDVMQSFVNTRQFSSLLEDSNYNKKLLTSTNFGTICVGVYISECDEVRALLSFDY